ncbi:MAG: hypothetical protein K2X00_13735 [Nitrospiraceae bacterium]|nr:hypothetical protein [Nitrospiraceae bacterium]
MKFTLGFVSGMAFALVIGVTFNTFAGRDDDSGRPYFGFGAQGETLFLDKKGNAYGSTTPYPQREERSKLNSLSPC